MKILKFTPELTDLILKGEKTTTWRLFDDKDLKVGDQFELHNKETGEKFAEAIIVSCRVKYLKDVNDEDFERHEKFADMNEMMATYKKYYGDSVTGETEVKVIHFSLDYIYE